MSKHTQPQESQETSLELISRKTTVLNKTSSDEKIEAIIANGNFVLVGLQDDPDDAEIFLLNIIARANNKPASAEAMGELLAAALRGIRAEQIKP